MSWSSLVTAIEGVISGAGVTIAPERDPSMWPSWAVAVGGSAQWVSVELDPSVSPLDGSGQTVTQHELNLRTFVCHPYSYSTTQKAAVDVARSLRALLDTPTGIVAETAMVEYTGVSFDALGAGIVVTTTFTAYQSESY